MMRDYALFGFFEIAEIKRRSDRHRPERPQFINSIKNEKKVSVEAVILLRFLRHQCLH